MELDENLKIDDVRSSVEVGDYQEMMELLADSGPDTDASTQESYSTEMRDLVAGFMTVSSAELTQYITLTDQLIDRHLSSHRNRPTTN